MCERRSAPRRHAYRAGHCWHCERSVRSVRLLSVPGGQALFGALGLEEPGGQKNLSKKTHIFPKPQFQTFSKTELKKKITCIWRERRRRRRDVSPWHAVHVGLSESHLGAGLPRVALPAVGQLILTLQRVKSARWARNGVARLLGTVESGWASETVLHT